MEPLQETTAVTIEGSIPWMAPEVAMDGARGSRYGKLW